MMKRNVILLMVLLLACSCAGSGTAGYDTVYYQPKYASGFDIVGSSGCSSRVVRVKAAWQGADSTAMELFIARGGETPPEGFRGQVLEERSLRLALMSSSYVGLLSCLGACGNVAAVSGLRFICDGGILARGNEIREIGSDADPDCEALLAAAVDLVLVYGVTSSSPMEKRLNALGIPYLYMGEYLEPHPLGRAEWMVVLAELLGSRGRGEAVFSDLVHRYDSLKQAAGDLAAGDRPKVMLNVPYGDTWFMASPRSAIVRMIEDAGGEYLFQGDGTNRSVPIDREEAFLLASEADVWLDTGAVRSVGELERSCPGFSSVKCVREGRIYNNDARRSPGGGNEFWESSTARPDMVLGDLIRILHSDPSGEDLYYYRPLEL